MATFYSIILQHIYDKHLQTDLEWKQMSVILSPNKAHPRLSHDQLVGR